MSQNYYNCERICYIFFTDDSRLFEHRDKDANSGLCSFVGFAHEPGVSHLTVFNAIICLSVCASRNIQFSDQFCCSFPHFV